MLYFKMINQVFISKFKFKLSYNFWGIKFDRIVFNSLREKQCKIMKPHFRNGSRFLPFFAKVEEHGRIDTKTIYKDKTYMRTHAHTHNTLLNDIRVIYFLIATFSGHPFIRRLHSETDGFGTKKHLFYRIFMI